MFKALSVKSSLTTAYICRSELEIPVVVSVRGRVYPPHAAGAIILVAKRFILNLSWKKLFAIDNKSLRLVRFVVSETDVSKSVLSKVILID